VIPAQQKIFIPDTELCDNSLTTSPELTMDLSQDSSAGDVTEDSTEASLLTMHIDLSGLVN